jgi:hypothetical protein
MFQEKGMQYPNPLIKIKRLFFLSLRGRFDCGNLIRKSEFASASPRNDNGYRWIWEYII